jgi:hypothetical protein
MRQIQVVKTRRVQSSVETDRRTPSGAVLPF